MAKIVITSLDEGVDAPRPATGELAIEGQVRTRQVLGEGRPVKLWTHKLAPGAVMRWTSVPVGRGVYLWEGAMSVDGKPIDGEGAAMIEHGASCEIRAGEAGCTLLEFHCIEEESGLPGGHVHALSAAQAPRGKSQRIEMEARSYADSDCPTCALWLHESNFFNGSGERRHYHTTDEVIICTRGDMSFGDRHVTRGGVLAIDRDAVYSFRIPESGGTFINFRGRDSDYVLVGPDGKQPPMSEKPMIRAIVKVAPHLVAAGQAQPVG